MRKYFIYLGIALAGIALSSCSSKQKTNDEQTATTTTETAVVADEGVDFFKAVPKEQLEGEWTVQKIGETEMTEVSLTLSFDIAKNRFAGNFGCNDYMGNLEFDDPADDDYDATEIDFDDLAGTLALCEHMDIEKQFTQLLDKVEHFTISENGELYLLDDFRKPLATLVRK